MFKALQHLLPNGRAWRTTGSGKPLTNLLKGFSVWGGDVKAAFDTDYDGLLPNTTSAIGEWEAQFGLPPSLTSESARRSRLDAAWKATGGQSPRYLQDTLRNAGFDVYVHDWWVPGSEAPIGGHVCAMPRNPLLYLRRTTIPNYPLVDCGEPFAACGEPFAECGNSLSPLGYPLVNKTPFSEPKPIILCGEPDAECGEPDAECGNFLVYDIVQRQYTIPTDPTKWPFFWYVGAEAFGTQASVPITRRDEFEALCLNIGPLHQWIGVMVNYV